MGGQEVLSSLHREEGDPRDLEKSGSGWGGGVARSSGLRMLLARLGEEKKLY